MLTSSINYYQKERDAIGGHFTQRRRLFFNQEFLYLIGGKTYILFGGKIFLGGEGGEAAGGVPYMEVGINF